MRVKAYNLDENRTRPRSEGGPTIEYCGSRDAKLQKARRPLCRAHREDVRVQEGVRQEARPPRRRQPSDRKGRGPRPRSVLHRGDAGLEARSRAPTRRAHRAHRARSAKGCEVELALLRSRGPGLVPRVPRLRSLRQGDLLPRRVAASGSSRRVEEQGNAIPRYLRGRRTRREAAGELDPAGGGHPRLERRISATRRSPTLDCAMVSLYVTAFGYRVSGKSAAEAATERYRTRRARESGESG